jgi:hypothetical protein
MFVAVFRLATARRDFSTNPENPGFHLVLRHSSGRVGGIVATPKAQKNMSSEICSHIDAVSTIKLPQKRVCEECVKIGAQWVHLRTCQTCGSTLCCDSSPNRHATKHAGASGHPVIASAEPDERWLYCYPDDAFAEF